MTKFGFLIMYSLNSGLQSGEKLVYESLWVLIVHSICILGASIIILLNISCFSFFYCDFVLTEIEFVCNNYWSAFGYFVRYLWFFTYGVFYAGLVVMVLKFLLILGKLIDTSIPAFLLLILSALFMKFNCCLYWDFLSFSVMFVIVLVRFAWVLSCSVKRNSGCLRGDYIFLGEYPLGVKT